MLKDDFFTVKDFVDEVDSRIYRLTLNASHTIFQAHFAGNPTMPGACIVQTIKELASDYLEKDFFVSSVKNTKFLHVINPLTYPEISVYINPEKQDNGDISIAAIIKDADTIFSKAIVVLKEKIIW